MKHTTSPEFWGLYHRLPTAVRRAADKQFDLLKRDPRHPSLHFKKVGRYWSARVNIHHRAVAVRANDGTYVWFWIGPHRPYEQMI